MVVIRKLHFSWAVIFYCWLTFNVPHNAAQTCDTKTQYDCLKNGVRCIQLSNVCNGVNNCGENEDERSDLCDTWTLNPCLTDNGGCEHDCFNDKINGYRCTCKPGFRLAANQKSCEDIDECETGEYCSQLCGNTNGGFECSCAEGYVPNSPNSCKAASGKAILLVAQGSEIRVVRPDTYYALIDHQKHSIDVDYDFARNIVYWADISVDGILAVNCTDDILTIADPPTVVVQEGIEDPESLALDWVHNNLYWVDTRKKHIAVMDIDTNMRTVVISKDTDKPRGLAVDPRDGQGYMYWTDWGRSPKIERAGLDGSRRKIMRATGLTLPNNIAIDFPQNRLYWVDAQLDIIGSVDLEGNGYRLVGSLSPNEGHHPFSVDVFEDTVYWTDWGTESEHMASKFDLSNQTTTPAHVRAGMPVQTPYGMKVYHALKQPRAANRCGENNGDCPHLCLPSPLWPGFSCLCSDGMHVDDKTTCHKQAKWMRPPKPRLASGSVITVSPPNNSGGKTLDYFLLLLAVMSMGLRQL